MAGIDEVIERSREEGGFAERKRFTVARSRAIQKMRQFALADTAYYILEWIQAAIANGATYLDLAIDWTEVRMSYVGGGLPRRELEALFDFLFASKDDLDVADTRQLALGVNALLAAKPDRIVIESGDGTMEGTTRVEIDGRTDTVSVGTPTRPLNGTFVRATGLSRARSQLKELRVIEERCLTATIPILVNDQPLFGYSSVRSPDLFGYRRMIKFDEGDLYGTIGLATTPITQNFKLLTWGTWITSARRSFTDVPPVGGVVGYDRLRKTADHSSIVQDDVYEEMWARLLPYARQLAAGKSGKATFAVRVLDGPPVTAPEFRALAQERNRVVIFEDKDVSNAETTALAARYGDALDAPVFVIEGRERETVRHLGGPRVEVFMPRLHPDELRFYEIPTAEPPQRPWLAAAIEVPDIDPDTLASRVKSIDDGPQSLGASVASRLRATTGVEATVYTPAELPEGAELWVELRLIGRTVWQGSVPSPYPGHHLVVDLADYPLGDIRGDTGDAQARLIGESVARHAEPVLAQATDRVLRALRPEDSVAMSGRRIALAALSRSLIKRVRLDDAGNPQIRFSMAVDDLPPILLQVRLFTTAAGEELSLRDLEGVLSRNSGLVFGVHTGQAVPDSIDPRDTLVLGPMTETLLGSLIGSTSYMHVGVGGRSVELPSPLSEEELPDALHQWHSDSTPIGVRRHVWRLLVCTAAQGDDAAREIVSELPLLLAPDGSMVAFAAISDALSSDEGLPMYDGWSADITTFAPRAVGRANALAMNPFVLHVLGTVGNIRPILDVDLDNLEAEANPLSPATAFLQSVELDNHGSRIGFPAVPVDDPVVLVVDRRHNTASALRSVASEFGIVGRVVNRGDGRHLEELEREVSGAARSLIGELIRRVPAMATETESYRRALEVLLDYAARRVRVTANPDRSLSVSSIDETTRRILDLPICPTTSGVSVSPWRMLREFATFRDRDSRPGRAEFAPDAPDVLVRWFDAVLDPTHFVGEFERPKLPPPSRFDRWLTDALDALRTDDDAPIDVRVLTRKDYETSLSIYSYGATDDIIVTDGTVFVCEDFWLLQRVTFDGADPDPEEAAWLLLAIYARVNELRLSVTNAHEVHFQSRILDWLEG